MEDIRIIAIDLFCGGGGVTTGLLKDPRVRVIACINHDKNAIKSHEANHPECYHFTEDIRTVQLEKLHLIVQKAKLQYPKALLLIQSQEGNSNLKINEGDSEKMIELKTYMKNNNICDIFMRYLNIPELLQIQGFPKDYKLIGTKTEQKKFIGNSVETTVMYKWIESIINKIEEYDNSN